MLFAGSSSSTSGILGTSSPGDRRRGHTSRGILWCYTRRTPPTFCRVRFWPSSPAPPKAGSRDGGRYRYTRTDKEATSWRRALRPSGWNLGSRGTCAYPSEGCWKSARLRICRRRFGSNDLLVPNAICSTDLVEQAGHKAVRNEKGSYGHAGEAPGLCQLLAGW